MEYRASTISFLRSLLLALSPILTAGIGTYFVFDCRNWFLWVVDVLMGLFSLYLLFQTLFVYSGRLYLDTNVIKAINTLASTQIAWRDITKAVLRERRNVLSHTDHLLILYSYNNVLTFNISILSDHDEKTVLDAIKAKTDLEIVQDTPSL